MKLTVLSHDPLGNPPQSSVIQNIKSRRIFLRYTQAYVGKYIGITQHAYSKIESGRIDLTVKQLMGIAEVLDCNSLIFFK